MTLLRTTIKDNFKTGDKPTEADFEQFINSGFNLHQFTYDETYPYEAGNIVYGLYLSKPSLYKRTNYSIGEVGVPITNSAYWMPLIVNIFNFPIVEPGGTAIDAPFAILNEDKSLIRYTNDQTDALPPIIQGKMLLFEERAYNMPGANIFKWELIDINSAQAIDTKYTRDYQWSFSQVGNFKVKLSVYEFGIETPVITEYPISVSAILGASMIMTVIANPTTYNSIGTVIDFAITYTNTGDYPITNITTSATIGNQSLSVQQISSLPVGQSTTVNTSYTTSSNDAGINSITLNAYGEGTTSINQVTANGSASVSNTNVFGNIAITQSFVYRTAYVNTPFVLPVTGTITPNVSNRIQSIEYIQSRWVNNTTQNYLVPSGSYATAIPDGTSFSYGFNINALSSTNINQVTLRYKDAYTSEAVSPSIVFYGQNRVNIQTVTLLNEGGQIKVVVVINKDPSVFENNTNTYTIYEQLEDNGFVQVNSEDYTESGTTKKTFTFFTDLLEDGVPADYSIKVIEDLGAMAPQINGQNMTSENIKPVSWTVDPKVYYGEILGHTTLLGVLYNTAWDDHFVPARLSENPWRTLQVGNTSSVVVDWSEAGYTNNTLLYPFIAFPKSIYTNAFTVLKDASGNVVPNGITNTFFVFDKTIDGIEYRVYTLRGSTPPSETHGYSAPPFLITLE